MTMFEVHPVHEEHREVISDLPYKPKPTQVFLQSSKLPNGITIVEVVIRHPLPAEEDQGVIYGDQVTIPFEMEFDGNVEVYATKYDRKVRPSDL